MGKRDRTGRRRATDTSTSPLSKLGLHPETWVGLSPNGLGRQKPKHFASMARIAWQQRSTAPYAWKVLSKGVCDGCALGVAGFRDWTIDGVHLCTTRLELLEFNTASALDPTVLADAERLAERTTTELRALGRLDRPMRRRAGDTGFSEISWDEALAAVGAAMAAAPTERIAWYLTSRGLTNETYYAAGKAARALGIANIDSAARVCHAPSTVGLKSTVGVAASTCSLQDVIESDLVVLWGTNPANNQPVFMKYLDQAVKAGTEVAVINPILEPGLEQYWVPSSVESAIFGTKIAGLHVPVRPGGDIAFANAVLKRLIQLDEIDDRFVADCTAGWDELAASLAETDLDDLLHAAGIDEATLDRFVERYAAASSAVFIWSMGITQHETGADGVRAIVNVALAGGNVGRDGAGLMPIRGHSGVQGGAEMGAYATAYPGGRPVSPEGAAEMAAAWGFEVPAAPGLTAPEMIDAAHDGNLDVLFSSGGNFVDVLPDPPRVREALSRVPLRVHADVVVSSQMLIPGDDVILLPVRTRYEQEGGGTSTTTERRVAFSPEIPRRVGSARSEWRLYGDLVAATDDTHVDEFAWPTNQDLRAEIAAVVPDYAGIERLSETGDAIQWGGRHLCAGGRFPTPDGRGQFSVLEVTPPPRLGPDEFFLSTRRGKQFNSIIWDDEDPLTGAARDAVFIDGADAAALGLAHGDPVELTSPSGTMAGRLFVTGLARSSVQVLWPEGNVLLPDDATRRERGSGIPDYNAVVTLAAVRP